MHYCYVYYLAFLGILCHIYSARSHFPKIPKLKKNNCLQILKFLFFDKFYFINSLVILYIDIIYLDHNHTLFSCLVHLQNSLYSPTLNYIFIIFFLKIYLIFKFNTVRRSIIGLNHSRSFKQKAKEGC